MSILTPEIAATFGAMDSGIYEDGGPVDAHVLRTLVTSAHRLVCRGEPLLQLVWDASSDLGGDESPGAMVGYGWPFWFRLSPPQISRPKKPGLTSAQAIVRAKLRAGEEALVQVETRRRPFLASATLGSDNVVQLTGSGSFAVTTLDDIPIDVSDAESVALWMRGVPTTTPGSSATYGATNTGTISLVSGDSLFDFSATWTPIGSGATYAESGHAVLVEDSGGVRVTEPRTIIMVTSANELKVYPAFDPGFARVASGLTYKIVELPQWRLTQVALYAQDRAG